MSTNPPLRCSKIGDSSPTTEECLECEISGDDCIVKYLLIEVRDLRKWKEDK